MTSYRQKIIPNTSVNSLLNFNKSDLQKFIRTYYHEKFQNKIKVINEDLNIIIEFIGEGKRKSAYGGAMNIKKAAAILILDQLLTFAKYSNWGERKQTDKKTVIGYLNFKVKLKIDGIRKHFALNVQLRNDGKFHYSLDECRF